MKSYVSVANYDWESYPVLDYTDIPSVTEPSDCPSMREIVERHIRGIDPGVTVYDDYDEEYQHLVQPGMDYFDVADMHRSEVEELNSKASRAMADKNLTDAEPIATPDLSEEEGDTDE